MENKQVSGKNMMRGLFLALALLILPFSGMASADDSATEVDLRDLVTESFGEEALYVDAETSLDILSEEDRGLLEIAGTDIVGMELGEIESGLFEGCITHEEIHADSSCPIAVVVFTDGEVAWAAVIYIGDVERYGPMPLPVLRERLGDFEGRILVYWIGDDVDEEPRCPHGYLIGGYNVNDEGMGYFQGQILSHDNESIGSLWGEFTNGTFHGEYEVRGNTGTLRGIYNANGSFRGVWQDDVDDVNGFLRGFYLDFEDRRGELRGKWKADCSEPDCAGDEDITPAKVKPMKLKKKPMKVDKKPMKVEKKDSLDKVKDLMDEEVIETKGGYSVDVGEAAAGSTLGTISLLGAGFLRRRLCGL